MNLNWKSLSRNLLAASAALLAAGCVAVIPPSEPNAGSGTAPAAAPQNAAPQAAGTDPNSAASLCTIQGTREQDLSKGTTKANITYSCKQTVIFIENAHAEQNKRCQVVIGQQVSEIYLKPGEGRSLTQTGPVMTNAVRVNCVNDWNRPK